jgi:hypothetical protein
VTGVALHDSSSGVLGAAFEEPVAAKATTVIASSNSRTFMTRGS